MHNKTSEAAQRNLISMSQKGLFRTLLTVAPIEPAKVFLLASLRDVFDREKIASR